MYEGFPYFFYQVVAPKMNDNEVILTDSLTEFAARTISFHELQRKLTGTDPRFSEMFRDKIINVIESEELLNKLPEPELFHALKIDLVAFLKEFAPSVSNLGSVANNILDNSIGYGLLSVMMRDPHLEEIMVNGSNKAVFVLHKEFGMCKSNVKIGKKDQQLVSLLSRVANTVKRKFDSSSPLLDARLPDGSRANATYNNVTPFGSTFTIRKFNYVPISIVDLIEHNTITSEVAGFLWMMVEGMNIEPMNLICTGGTSSGKTSTLNALGAFVSQRDRLITIEDTIEINFGAERENWVQMEAKAQTRDSPEITMDELLRNSLRMRPDRLIVGEVRGPEAQTLFVAMDTGHRGCMGTLHANTAREMLIRLKNAPMNVPEQMLPLLDLVLVHYRMYDREKGLIRRVAQIAEISRMEERVLLSNIFEWHPKRDTILRTDIPSHVMQTLSDKTGLTKKALKSEMLVRQRTLEWCLENGIKANPEVAKIVQQYYFDPASILEKVSK